MTTTHRKNVPINDEALAKRSAKNIQVFLRVPAQSRTLSLMLKGGETIQEIQASISLLLGVPKCDISLTLKGAPLNPCLVNSDATIVVLFRGLQGGADFEKFGKLDGDQKPNDSVNQEHPEQPVVTLKMNGYEEVTFDPTKTTFAEMEKKFKEQNKLLEKKKLVYKLQKSDATQNDDEEMKTIEQPSQADENKNLSEMDPPVNPGDKIIAEEGAESKVADPEDAFFSNKCHAAVSRVKDKIKKELGLSQQQKTFMKNLEDATLEDDKGLTMILQVLNDHQMEKLITDFQRLDKRKILEYLLKTCKQWTAISPKILDNTLLETMDKQIRRLMNKHKNNNFNSQKSGDILDLLKKHRQAVLKPLYSNLNTIQKMEIFMEMLDERQRFDLLFKMIEPQNVWQFWEILSKKRRIEYWEILKERSDGKEYKDKLFLDANLTYGNLLQDHQKQRLWNNISLSDRLNYWNSIDVPPQYELSIEGKLEEIKETPRSKVLQWLTIAQLVNLWKELTVFEQKKLVEVISNDSKKTIEFWEKLNYDHKCSMLHNLDPEKINKLFQEMNIENRTLLISMVNEDIRKKLEDGLNEEDQKALFYYEYFFMKENTGLKPGEFIENLVKENLAKNNQHVPFAKIDDGYVQVIRNPYLKTEAGFIVVQVVAKQYQTINIKQREELDQNEQKETGEEKQGTEKPKNDSLRMNQNRYGQIEEVEPNYARNASKIGMISFFEYSKKLGIHCTHTFFVSNPIFFKWKSGLNNSASEICLYKGQNNEIFFFNKKESGQKSRRTQDSQYELQLQVIQPIQNSQNGEFSRDVSENCFTYNIDKDSELAKFLEPDIAELQGLQELKVNRLNVVPTLIEDYNKDNIKSKFVVFNLIDKLHFYSINQGREVASIGKAEALIDYIRNEQNPEKGGQLTFLKETDIWTMHPFNLIDYETQAENEKDQYVVRCYVPDPPAEPDDETKKVKDFKIQKWLKENPTTTFKRVGADNQPLPDNLTIQKFPIERANELSISQIFYFRDRYLRNTPVFVEPGKVNPKTGYVESFTLLCQHFVSFTFSITISESLRKQAQKKKEIEEQKAKDDEAKQRAKEKDKGKSGGDSKARVDPADEDANNDRLSQARAGAAAEICFGSTKENHVYKCKYIIPNASQILYDDNKKKTFVQVYNQQESMKVLAEEQEDDEEKKIFTIILYDITDVAPKNRPESTPIEQETELPISGAALKAYLQNTQTSTFVDLKLIACPVLFTSDQSTIGAWIYEYKQQEEWKLSKKMLHWFEQSAYRSESARVIQPINQTVNVNYPFLVYKGFALDNRELIMVNLADNQQQQKIIHLYDLQFICFVGHSFSDRAAKVAFLAFDQNRENIKLCWLVCHQPFKKKLLSELQDFTIEERTIRFDVPILNDIENIRDVQLVKGLDSNFEDGMLVIQTSSGIYTSDNLSGIFEDLTNGLMATITMQRGLHSRLYYAITNETKTDAIVKELYLYKKGADWFQRIVDVLKISEGNCIALEMDPESLAEIDSVYTYSNQLKEHNPEAINKLYILSDTKKLFRMTEKSDIDGGGYEIMSEKDLSISKDLMQDLSQYQLKPFNRLSISERVITINERNYNFNNFHSWELDSSIKVESVAVYDTLDTVEEGDDGQVGQNQTKDKDTWQDLISVKSIRWTSRMLIHNYTQEYDETIQGYVNKNTFITKLLPGSRRQDLVGRRSLRDMQSINFISDSLFLIKFRSSDNSGCLDYWTVVDKFGQIKPLPDGCKKYLKWSYFASGQSRLKLSGTTLVLRGGQKSVLTMKSDSAYEENGVVVIEFNRVGEVAFIKTFEKKDYDGELRAQIEDKFILSKHMNMKDQTDDQEKKRLAKLAANTLGYSDEVLVTGSGDLYRIATIVNKEFLDSVAINPLDLSLQKRVDRQTRNQKRKESWFGSCFKKQVEEKDLMNDENSDELNMGIFVVNSSTNQSEKLFGDQIQSSISSHSNKTLKIILLLCKSERHRFQMKTASIAICGDYFCWSYPQEKLVHIIKMTEINKLEAKKTYTKTAIDAMSHIRRGLTNIVFEMGKGAKKMQSNLHSSLPSNVSIRQEKEGLTTPLLPPNIELQNSDYMQKIAQRHSQLLMKQAHGITSPLMRERNSPQKSNSDVKKATQQAQSLTQQASDMPFKIAIKPSHNRNRSRIFVDSEDETEPEAGDKEQGVDEGKNKVQPVAINDSFVQGHNTYRETTLVDEEPEMEDAFSTARDQLMIAESEVNVELMTWMSYKTIIINLRTIAENEGDCYKTILSEVPYSTQLSIVESKEKVSKKKKKQSKDKQTSGISLKENLLQITIGDRIIIYDLTSGKPQEITFFNATSQLIHANRYVDSGIKISQCFEDPSPEKDGYLFTQVNSNRSGDICVINQDRRVFSRNFVWDNIERNQVCLSVFKKYAEVDLMELDRIQKKVSSQAKLDNIDLQTVLCVFDHHTVFSLFAHSIKLHEQVLQQLEEGEFLPEEQEDETEIENNIIRRLYRILVLPTPDIIDPEEKADKGAITQEANDQDNQDQNEEKENGEDEVNVNEKAGLRSVLFKSFYGKIPRIKDCLLSITNKCEECSISNFCETQNDFERLLKNLNPSSLELIQDSFISTPFTKKIVNTGWHDDQTVITFRKNTSIITEAECGKLINDILRDEGVQPNDMTKAQVEVRMLNLSWLLESGKDFVSFVTILEDTSSNQIYETELISTLLEEFWDENYKKILLYCLLPWASYAICLLAFITLALTDHDQENSEIHGWIGTIGSLTAILLFYQLYIEIRQFLINDEKSGYFMNLTNMMDLYQYLSSIFIITVCLIEISYPGDLLVTKSNLRVIACFTSFCLWMKVLDWCKLFGPTAFYIQLITLTIYDIRYFVLIFVICLMMFGTPLFMLNLNRTDDNALIDQTFGSFWPINVAYNQYMLAVGDFSTDAYSDQPQGTLCYIILIASLFITQVTFLNMLVAIMGSTFEAVTEQQEQFGLKTKLDIMGDYVSIIKSNQKEKDQDIYLFVVTKKTDAADDPNAAWAGSLADIKKNVDKNIQTLGMQIEKKIEKVYAGQLDTKTNLNKLESNIQAELQKLTSSQGSLDKTIPELKSGFKKLLDSFQLSQKNMESSMVTLSGQIGELKQQMIQDKVQRQSAQNDKLLSVPESDD